MELEELCDPSKNPHLANMLREVGFNYTGANYTGTRLVPFTNPKTNAVSGTLIISDETDSVLVLHPGLGTSVLDHQVLNIFRETVTYMGSIKPDEATLALSLKHKYQDGGTERDESRDKVVDIQLGSPVITLDFRRDQGRYHGFHNISQVPVALRIVRTFRKNL